MTHTTAPEYTDRDTYTGRWRVTKSPRNAAYGIGSASARDLADTYGAGTPFIIWEYAGNLHNGLRLFARTRFIADSEGDLHGYDSNGRKVIIHPADRKVRFLTRNA